MVAVTTEELLLERIADGLDKLIALLTPEQDSSAGPTDEPPAAAALPRSGGGRRPAKKSAGK